MCAACVAQGAVYVGGAVGALRLMAARASMKRRADEQHDDDVGANEAPVARR